MSLQTHCAVDSDLVMQKKKYGDFQNAYICYSGYLHSDLM